MSNQDDAFLKDLQLQCLTDSKEYLDGFLEALSNFQTDLPKALGKIANHIHSLKGNVQAAGFVDFGKFLHDSESILTVIESGIKSGNYSINDDDRGAFEFFLSDVRYYMQDYAAGLSKDLKDSPEMYHSRKMCLDNLELWWKTLVEQRSGVSPQKEASSITGVPPVANEVPKVQDDQGATGTIGSDSSQGTRPTPTPTAAAVRSKMDSSKKESASVARPYLVCRAGKNHFAIGVDSVVEIVSKLVLNSLPVQRSDIRGMVNLHGEPISILNMESIFGSVNQSRYIVVCNLEGRSFGFEVEDAEQVMTIGKEKFQEVPEAMGSSEGKNRAVTHIAHLEDREILVLNLKEIFAA